MPAGNVSSSSTLQISFGLVADEDGYFGMTPRSVINDQGDELRVVNRESVDLVSGAWVKCCSVLVLSELLCTDSL